MPTNTLADLRGVRTEPKFFPFHGVFVNFCQNGGLAPSMPFLDQPPNLAIQRQANFDTLSIYYTSCETHIVTIPYGKKLKKIGKIENYKLQRLLNVEITKCKDYSFNFKVIEKYFLSPVEVR